MFPSLPPSLRFPPLVRAPSLSVSLLSGTVLAAMIGLVSPDPAAAQTSQATAAPAKQASAAKKSPVAKPAKGPARKKVAEPKEEPEVAVADADDQQLAAAREVLLGESGCEFDQKIQVDASAKHPGYVDMSFNKKRYTMKPVMSSTGALRLEDVRSEALMIQIASKSMVMNQKTGQRLVDNCVHPDQKTVSADTTQVLMK